MNPYLVIKKSTQCGVSEYLIVRANGKAIKGQSVFYVLPTFDLVGRYVKNRYQKTINYTKFYRELQIATKDNNSKSSESIRLKDLGKGSIAYVGSNSTVGFTEYPADDIIIDELDECDPENIEMAWERLSHSDIRTQAKVGNPTIEGFGIDKEYNETDKKKWRVRCNCGKFIEIDWFLHIVREVEKGVYIIRDQSWEWNSDRDIYPICNFCQRPLNRKGFGEWVKEKENKKSGYEIAKLFSGKTLIIDILDRFNKGLVDPVIEKRFWNADLGKAFSPKGAKITETMLNKILGNHPNKMNEVHGIRCIGIDVGSILNVVIGELQSDSRFKIINICTLQTDVDEVKKLIKEYNVKFGIVDGLPEQYFARKLKNGIKGMFTCFYNDGKRDPLDNYKCLTVNRTASLDAVKEAIVVKNIILPRDAKGIENFYSQMTASTRVFNEKLDKGRGGFMWTEGSKDDHYFHAMNYLLLCKKLIILSNR